MSQNTRSRETSGAAPPRRRADRRPGPAAEAGRAAGRDARALRRTAPLPALSPCSRCEARREARPPAALQSLPRGGGRVRCAHGAPRRPACAQRAPRGRPGRPWPAARRWRQTQRRSIRRLRAARGREGRQRDAAATDARAGRVARLLAPRRPAGVRRRPGRSPERGSESRSQRLRSEIAPPPPSKGAFYYERLQAHRIDERCSATPHSSSAAVGTFFFLLNFVIFYFLRTA